jgi:multidrug efflux pump subunit AcrB
VVALTLGGSWIAALYFLPALTVWLIGRTIHKENASKTKSRFQNAYGSVLRFAVRIPAVVLGVSFLLVLFSAVQFSRLSKQMFPLSERNQFLIYMNLPDGTDISTTEASALSVAEWLSNPKVNPEITSHIVYVGDGGPRFYLTLTPAPAARRPLSF